MLDAHRELAVPPETWFLRTLVEDPRRFDSRRRLHAFVTGSPTWPDMRLDAEEYGQALRAIRPWSLAEGVRAFYGLCAARQGKPRAGDKTPDYLRYLDRIEALLPDARFVHVIRDGRDVAVSIRGLPFGARRRDRRNRPGLGRRDHDRPPAGRALRPLPRGAVRGSPRFSPGRAPARRGLPRASLGSCHGALPRTGRSAARRDRHQKIGGRLDPRNPRRAARMGPTSCSSARPLAGGSLAPRAHRGGGRGLRRRCRTASRRAGLRDGLASQEGADDVEVSVGLLRPGAVGAPLEDV